MFNNDGYSCNGKLEISYMYAQILMLPQMREP